MNKLICRAKRCSAKILFLIVWASFELILGSSAQNESEVLADPGAAAVEKEQIKRDPFWPVGYVPKGQEVEVPVEEKSVVQVDWESAEKQLDISAVGETKSGAPFVLINRKMMAERTQFQINVNKVNYTWEVPEIDPSKGAQAVEPRRISAVKDLK